MEENVDYFNQADNNESLKRYAFEKFGWIGRDGYEPISDKRTSKLPRKPEPNEVKQIFHRDKGKMKVAKKCSSASAKHKIAKFSTGDKVRK